MTSSSRSSPPDRRRRTAARKSGVLKTCSLLHGEQEVRPAAALLRQECLALRRQPVVSAPALPRFLDPAAGNELPALHFIEDGIERCDIEGDDTGRALRDALADLI